MKKITTVLLVLLISAGVYAQSFKIAVGTQDITNTTYTVSGTDFPMEVDFTVENLTVDTINTMLKRYEINVISGTKNYFCWGDCFEPIDAGVFPEWLGAAPIKLGENQVEVSPHAYYTHENKAGISTFLYVVYNVADPNDSAYVEIVFDVPQYVGVSELTEADVQLNAGPNPATNLITINYQLANYNGNNARVVIVDLLGKKQGEYPIRNKKGRLEIDATSYVPGIYFYTLQVDNRMITTKKIIVN